MALEDQTTQLACHVVSELILRCDECGHVQTSGYRHDPRGAAEELAKSGWAVRVSRALCAPCVSRHDRWIACASESDR